MGKGFFQLYSKKKSSLASSILLPEDQIEVVTLQQRWLELYGSPLPIKARIPSWSLIADICCHSTEIGFLPDFLAKALGLHPVAKQPTASPYRLLALHKNSTKGFRERLDTILDAWKEIFSHS